MWLSVVLVVCLISIAVGAPGIKNRQSGLCLDVNGTAIAPKASLKVANCNGRSSQRYTFSDDSRLTITDPKTMRQLCVDVGGADMKDGGELKLWDCFDQPKAEVITYYDVGTLTLTDGFKLFCVTPPNVTKGESGMRIQTCSQTNAGQLWDVVEAPPTPPPDQFAIRSRSTGHCVEVSNAQQPRGAQLWMRACADTASQRWAWNSDGLLVYDGQKVWLYCVDAPGEDLREGNQLWLWDCDASLTSQALMHDDASGTFFFANSADATFCLKDGGPQETAPLLIGACDDNDKGQQWDVLRRKTTVATWIF